MYKEKRRNWENTNAQILRFLCGILPFTFCSKRLRYPVYAHHMLHAACHRLLPAAGAL